MDYDDAARDLTIAEVAKLLGMSERWVRNQIATGAEHQRYGNRTRFTPAQLAKLRERHTQVESAPPPPPITTGRRKDRNRW